MTTNELKRIKEIIACNEDIDTIIELEKLFQAHADKRCDSCKYNLSKKK